MKPIAIFRHAESEGPGYFATFLDSHSVPWELFAIDRGARVPDKASAFGGLVFMGGPMSVNDDLPWMRSELDLIRAAVAADVPVLGHCLGGQLIAKALGAQVSRTPVKEIGWGEVSVLDNPPAHAWFGDCRAFESFHWHGETFGIPPGFTRVLESRWCPDQACVRGKHLAMQCHVEMTSDMIEEWCRLGADEIAASDSPAVQAPAAIRTDIERRVAALQAVAARLYACWLDGVER